MILIGKADLQGLNFMRTKSYEARTIIYQYHLHANTSIAYVVFYLDYINSITLQMLTCNVSLDT